MHVPTRILYTLPLLTFTALPAARAQAPKPEPAAPNAYARPEPPGRCLDIGGRKLHVLAKGERRGPTVVLEAGLSQFTANSTYAPAQQRLAGFARVVSYDRAGLGWSDPAPGERTLEDLAADLRRLLKTADEPGPYVLVAHSLGGLVARTFARLYPDAVVGMVLLDATSDEDFAILDAARDVTVPQLDAAIAGATPGVPVIGLPVGTSAEVMMAYTPEILRGVRAEFAVLDRVPPERRKAGGFGTLGDLPLVVVRRGKTSLPPSADDLQHQRVQENLARLSTDGVLVVAAKSGHTIPLDEPDVVVEAVRRVLDAVRTGHRLRAQDVAPDAPQQPAAR